MSKKFVFINASGYYEETAGAFEEADFISSSAGAGDAGKPIIADAGGKLDASLIDQTDIDHGSISGLSDDDHSQYILVAGTRAFTGSQSMGGNKITSLGTGASDITNATDAANKAYVDAVATGLSPKGNVDTATTTYLENNSSVSSAVYDDDSTITVTLAVSDTFIVDGVTYSSSDNGTRVLIKDEGDVSGLGATANGIYTTTISGTSLTLTRSTDQDNDPLSEVVNGVFIPKILQGTANSGKPYVITSVGTGTDGVHTFGTDDITFSEFTSPTQLSSGDGIDIVSNVVSVDIKASDGLKIDTTELTVDYAATLTIDGADSLPLKASDLASTSNAKGASVVGIEDSGSNFTATNVESALAELYGLVETPSGTLGTNITKAQPVYYSANNTISLYSSLSSDYFVAGCAYEAGSTSETVRYVDSEKILTGVLTSFTAGAEVYWDGSAFTATMPSTSGYNVWQLGVAVNATDMLVKVKFIKKNA